MNHGPTSMATIHPDYLTPRHNKVKALAANTYEPGVAFVRSITLEPRRKGVPRYADVIIGTQDQSVPAHTVRVWRKGPISFLDCTHGTISGQDTMRLFGAANDCPACMPLVQHIRAHRGWKDAQWVMNGNSYGFMTLRTAFRDDFMARLHGEWREKGETRVSRDRERVDLMDRHPDKGSYADRVTASIKQRLHSVHVTQLSGYDIRGSVSTGYSASATCYKRGWGRGNKRLNLTVPASWVKVLWDCGGVLDGYLVGATLSQTETLRECWAIKPMSPVDQTTWWRARFVKVDGRHDHGTPQPWQFKQWVRNGAMGGGK